MPDFAIVQGQTIPTFKDTLTYSDGTLAEPESVAFVLRAPTSSEPLTLTGVATVVSKTAGTVQFAPSAADTASPGNYMACWEAKIGGATMTFPTEGYLWVQVQPNLKLTRRLIGVPEVKQALYIQANDHIHDDLFEEYIEAATPMIENLTGPLLPKVYDEWHEGGHTMVKLRHAPSYGYGTSPVLFVMAVSEYRGPIEYNMSLIPTPTQGSVYSEMTHGELGVIVRRTSGGGSVPWPRDAQHPAQSVHVVYYAGQETTPANVKRAMIETIRWWHDTTQGAGRGSLNSGDPETFGRPFVALPYHAEAMLGATRRPPVVA